MAITVQAQEKICWQPNYKFQLSDFKSPATQIGGINMISVSTAANFSFAYQMSRGEFMFTKNFNNKVSCDFQPDAATIIAPDSATARRLLDYACYQFDLAELYARKLRKAIYEHKHAFSNAGFFKPLYDSVEAQYVKRYTLSEKNTRFGTDSEKLYELHQEVLKEIAALPDFCQKCKPQKRKKHKHQ